MNEVINSRFAPTPMHGAAYAVAIETVGGIQGIANCDTRGKYETLIKRLTELGAWARTQDAYVSAAYRYGIEKVEADLKSRIDVHENHRRVRAALETISKPPGA